MDIYDAGMLLQFDVTHKVLRNDTALDVMCEIRETLLREHDRYDIEEFQNKTKSALLGSVVITP